MKTLRKCRLFSKSATSSLIGPFHKAIQPKNQHCLWFFLFKTWSGVNIMFSLFQLTFRSPNLKYPLIFYLIMWRLWHQQINECYFVTHTMDHDIMCVKLLSNNGKRSWIQRHDMIPCNLAWWLKDQSLYTIRSWDSRNPSFVCMIKNCICSTILELSYLTQWIRIESYWMKWSCHKRSPFIICQKYSWMVHFIGLLGRETYLYLMWKGRDIACFHFPYQSLR
jgi:hypothetical protein